MNISRNKSRGFTLIELLVTVGIIGILATITVASLSSTQKRARDARRLSDIKQIQNILQIYFNDKDKYPDSGGSSLVLGGSAGSYSVLCDSVAGFQIDKTGCGTILMDPVFGDPQSGPGSIQEYKYKSADDLSDYTIKFTYEAGAGGNQAGDRTATKAGIQ